MKRNGFTLIELLAVIVILAIIALIATPIILGIINDTREKASERSVELYASAINNAVAAYQLRELKKPKNFSDLTIEYEGSIECKMQELYEDGSFYLEGCKVNGGIKEYSYGTKQEAEKVCSIKQNDASKYSKGDEVTCNIGETPDTFYVIEDAELSANTIQMLTEKNIHTEEFRQSDDAGPVVFSRTNYWSSETTYPADIYDKGENNLKSIVNNYISYLNTKLTNATGSLLTYSQAENLGCSGSNYSCSSAPSWVYLTYYWTGSADALGVWNVDSNGGFSYANSGYNGTVDFDIALNTGVRPVITISTSYINL